MPKPSFMRVKLSSKYPFTLNELPYSRADIPMQIKNSVFLVTGGASGLGAATARMAAEHGGKVVIADMQADVGEKFAKEIGARFRDSAAFRCWGTAPASRLPSAPSARRRRMTSGASCA